MYAKNYFKAGSHDFYAFFSGNDNAEEEKKILKEITKAKKELAQMTQNLTELYSNRYTENLTTIYDKIIIAYESRNGATYEFDLITGLPYESNEEENIERKLVFNKKGNVRCLIGYCYPLGAVLYRNYSFIINSSNTGLKSSLEEEMLVPIFDIKLYTKNCCSNVTFSMDENAKDFLNTFFDTNKDVSLSLGEVKRFYEKNPSFEIIYRTSKNMDEMRALLNYPCEKPMPIYSILGCTKEDYEILSKNDLIPEFISILNYLKAIEEEEFKTKHELVEFILKCKKWEEDLEFYKIDCYGHLSLSLISAYLRGKLDTYEYCSFKQFPNFYPFGKFCNYIVTESINQGYTSIKNFIVKLRDYIVMCSDLDITPTLYSSYLAITHDITARNHSIVISEDQERIFKNKYKDFETYKGKDYVVIAPKDSKDVMEEGDKLNHCVASYIKKILDGTCNIFFMRSIEDIGKRLITVEVAGDTVCQARGLHDRDITAPERKALMEFCKNRGLKFNI